MTVNINFHSVLPTVGFTTSCIQLTMKAALGVYQGMYQGGKSIREAIQGKEELWEGGDHRTGTASGFTTA